MKTFWLCFVPLFVAVDAIGMLPMYMGLIGQVEPVRRRRVLVQSVLTALGAALAFLYAGSWLLGMLGMTVADFMIAGGLLLFAISMSDMLSGTKRQRQVDPESVGAVPIGVPLITGPAVLTTSILLSNAHGTALTSMAVALNILLAGAVFWNADRLNALLGKAGVRTLSKMASLLLASIGVMMVRKGIMQIAAMT